MENYLSQLEKQLDENENKINELTKKGIFDMNKFGIKKFETISTLKIFIIF